MPGSRRRRSRHRKPKTHRRHRKSHKKSKKKRRSKRKKTAWQLLVSKKLKSGLTFSEALVAAKKEYKK